MVEPKALGAELLTQHPDMPRRHGVMVAFVAEFPYEMASQDAVKFQHVFSGSNAAGTLPVPRPALFGATVAQFHAVAFRTERRFLAKIVAGIRIVTEGNMNEHVITSLSLAVIVAVAASCQPHPKEGQSAATAPRDTVVSQGIQPAESGYADVNGLKMYYEVYGKGNPIVLLHGSYMSIPLNWSRIIPLLAEDRKVIVAEMQGHGRTRDIPREFSYEGMADDVSGLLEYLKVESADILGYSMGGGVAFQVAVRHPRQVRRLVVLSGTYTHDGWWPDVEASFATFTADMFEGTPIQKEYVSLGNDPAHFPEFVKKVISIDLKPYDWSEDVKNIEAPIFMAIGDADGVRYEHALELFRARGGGKMGDLHGLPPSRLAIIPGTTHVGMMQRAEWLVPMITDFLDSDLDAAPPTF